MLRSRIAPCLLLDGGELIKTRNFKPWKYVGDPVNAVKIFNEKQVDELILLDVSASVRGMSPDYHLLAEIAAGARMPLCYGGGIKDVETAKQLISLGFEKISLSSAAIENPDLVMRISDAIGRQSVCVTLDVLREPAGNYRLYTQRGTKEVELSLLEGIAKFSGNCGELIINGIHRDGTMNGYDLELATIVRRSSDSPLTFIGGAGSIEHMQQLIDCIGVCGAAAGSIFVFRGKYNAVLLSYERPSNYGNPIITFNQKNAELK